MNLECRQQMFYFHTNNLIILHNICLSKSRLYQCHLSKLNHWSKYESFPHKHIMFILDCKHLNIYHWHFD